MGLNRTIMLIIMVLILYNSDSPTIIPGNYYIVIHSDLLVINNNQIPYYGISSDL